MRNFSFFGKQQQNKLLALLVDIGSASVGAALIEIHKGKPPQMHKTVREIIPFQEVLSSPRFLVAMNHTLMRALARVQEETKEFGVPTYIVCTLSSPWFILKSRHLRIERKAAFEITERTLAEFVLENIEKLKEEIKDILPAPQIEIIEKHVIRVKLNGYEVKNPYAQKTTHAEIDAVVGVSSKRVIESTKRVLGNFVQSGAIRFGVFPLAAFSAIRDIFLHEESFLFLDITGEATDVSLVKDNLLMGTVSFPYGKNFFIRKLSAGLSTPQEDAISTFAMFLSGTLGQKKHGRVKEMIEASSAEWLASFENALGELSREGVLPHKIFFASDNDIAKTFASAIQEAKSTLLQGEHFEAEYLDHSIVARFVSFDVGVVRDPFIIIEALFAQKLFAQK